MTADGREERTRRFYRWLGRISVSRWSIAAMLAISFLESSILPLAPDPLLVPMMLQRPGRIWWYAFLCMAASVLGALVGYALGALLFDAVGRPILDFYGLGPAFETYQALFAEWGFWIILAKGVTPIPFKLVAIASGVAHLDMGIFLVACTLSRSARFFLVAALVRWWGAPVLAVLDRRVGVATLVGLILLAAALL